MTMRNADRAVDCDARRQARLPLVPPRGTKDDKAHGVARKPNIGAVVGPQSSPLRSSTRCSLSYRRQEEARHPKTDFANYLFRKIPRRTSRRRCQHGPNTVKHPAWAGEEDGGWEHRCAEDCDPGAPPKVA
jgi:hypothetical protein